MNLFGYVQLNVHVALVVLVVTTKCSTTPNIVIFLADDLGIGDVGCFGNDTINTKNIDSIAQQGALLTHHLATAAVCTPSRAALLTGRYPVRQGMESTNLNKVLIFLASSGGLPSNETTFAKILQERGYSTAIIGKWHLGLNCNSLGDNCHHPLTHGFDYYYGLPLTNVKDFGDDGASVVLTYSPYFYNIIHSLILIGLTMSFWLSKYQKFYSLIMCVFILILLPLTAKIFVKNWNVLNGVIMRNFEVVEQPVKLSGLTQKFVMEATSFIKDNAQRQKPFLLFLPFVHVHTSLFTAPEFANKSVHGKYGDNIQEMDWAIGEVLKTLEETSLKDNTFVYFSSDNGGHLEETGLDNSQEGGYNGKFKGGKCMGGMEGGIRVPTAVMWPSFIPPGLKVTVPTSQMDLFPTLLEITESLSSSKVVIDGKSLIPLLTNRAQVSAHQLLVHYCGANVHAVRHIDDLGTVWKIHYAAPKWLPGTYRCHYVCQCYGDHVQYYDPPLVYNLNDDPYEDQSLDISSDSKLIKLVEKINKDLAEHKLSIGQISSQFNFWNSLWKPWLQPCCNFPYCNCQDEKFEKQSVNM